MKSHSNYTALYIYPLFLLIVCSNSGGAQAQSDSSAELNQCKNLIINGDFEAGNIGFLSDYQYAPDYIDHGRYTITSDIHGLDKSAVSPLNGDHTSGHGKYMVIDSEIYRKSDRSKVWSSGRIRVRKNTAYSFSVWLARTGIGSPPELQVLIDGKAISPAYRLDFQPGTWNELSYSWKSNKSGKVSICILSIYYYQYMEDFLMDDMTFCTVPKTIE